VGKNAVRFLCFDTVKNAFKDKESGALRPWRNMLAGMTAGVVFLCAVTPIERIKTALSDDAGQGKRYTFNIHCIRTIIQEDRFKGLYLDLVGTLKQASVTSFKVGIYNIIKHFEENKCVQQSTRLDFFVAVAGVITTVLSQSLIRSRRGVRVRGRRLQCWMLEVYWSRMRGGVFGREPW